MPESDVTVSATFAEILQGTVYYWYIGQDEQTSINNVGTSFPGWQKIGNDPSVHIEIDTRISTGTPIAGTKNSRWYFYLPKNAKIVMLNTLGVDKANDNTAHNEPIKDVTFDGVVYRCYNTGSGRNMQSYKIILN